MFLCFMEKKKLFHTLKTPIRGWHQTAPINENSKYTSHEKPILMGRQDSAHIDPLAVQACFRCRALMSDTWHNENSKISPNPDQFIHFFGFFGGEDEIFNQKNLNYKKDIQEIWWKFSLIGLGCFKIFKGNTLCMRLRGLTIQPLFEEWVVDSTTSKKGDLGCSIDGFKYPVLTCYTPTSSPLPLDPSQQKRTWKNESTKSPEKISREQIHQNSITFFSNLTPNRSKHSNQNPFPWVGSLEGAINFSIWAFSLSSKTASTQRVSSLRKKWKKPHDTKLVSKMYGFDMPFKSFWSVLENHPKSS